MVRYCDISTNHAEFLAMTGLTVEEFNHLVPFFHACFEAYLQTHTIEGYERQNRRYVPYQNRTFSTTEDMLLYILVYVKQYPTQTLLGQLFGMKQSQVNRWIHLLHPLLNTALERAGCRPERTGVTIEEDHEYADVSPLLSMMAVSDQSTVPMKKMSSTCITVERRTRTRSRIYS